MSIRNEYYEMKLDCCYIQIQAPLSNENRALSVSEHPGYFFLISFLYIWEKLENLKNSVPKLESFTILYFFCLLHFPFSPDKTILRFLTHHPNCHLLLPDVKPTSFTFLVEKSFV